MTKTKGVVVLIVWFMWAAGKDLGTLVRYGVTTDYQVLAAAGFGWLFFVLAFAAFLTSTAGVYRLFRPAPDGPMVLWAALAAGLVQTLVGAAFMLRDLPAAREAYARGRELRGMAVREDALDMIFTTEAVLTAAGIAVAIAIALAALVYRNRAYFNAPTASAMP